MNYNFIKGTLASIFAIMVLGGCGSDNTRSDLPTYVSGGTEQSPAIMSLEGGNLIVANSFYNYFEYDALDGEKLYLESILTKGITDSQREDCEVNSETFIIVHDASMTPIEYYRTCSSIMSVEFMEEGKYIFQIKYPGNLGHFNASLKK